MSDQTKLTIHFLVSKLVILAVPLLNQLLIAFGINVTTSNNTVDSLANMICIGLGLAYSWWSHKQAVKTQPEAIPFRPDAPRNSVPQPPPPKPVDKIDS